MIAAIVIPAFDLRAALRLRPRLQAKPAALAPLPGTEPLIGSVTGPAEAKGVRPGMRLGEALAMCPELELVEQDPATAEQAWEEILRRLEDAGFAVEPAEPGTVFFETKGVERLYGGLEPALKRALAAVGAVWDARAGAAERRFAALAAANVARPGQALIVSDDRTRSFLAPLPLTLLPLERSRYEELEELGVRTIGQLAGLPGSAVAERLGPDGRRAWSLARGEQDGRVAPRRPAAALHETLEFPEAVGNELTLRRGLAVLLDRLLARPERAGRPPQEGRGVGAARRRRLVAPDGDAARADRRPGAAPRRARAEARGAAGAGAEAPARDLGARRAHRRAARARRRGGRRAAGAAPGRPAPGEGSRRRRRGLDGGGGRPVVAHTRKRARCSFRATTERTPPGARRRPRRRHAAHASTGRQSPSCARSGASSTAGGPRSRSHRRYFDLVLETGENAVVYHDDDAGSWFTQRA